MKRIIKYISVITVLLSLLVTFSTTASAENYTTYTYSYDARYQVSPDAFATDEEYSLFDNLALKKPSDVVSDSNGRIIISDTGNNRIVISQPDFSSAISVYSYVHNGITVNFSEPTGLCVTENDLVYVADTGNSVIVILNPDGSTYSVFDHTPTTAQLGGFSYIPVAVGVDSLERVFILSRDTPGLILMDKNGEFQGVIGAQDVTVDFSDYIWRMFMTREQIMNSKQYVPITYNNLFIDSKGFIYVTSYVENGYALQQAIHEPNRNGVLKDEREVLDPLWMLNHLHVADIRRNGKRPMYFSRFAGVGSHRYSLGFSGDVFITWSSLDFQPYFTATASNIGYCWWSHDIGGHFYGYGDSELATRWIQLGIFSPINRLHSQGNPFISKEPWNYPAKNEKVIKKYLNLRYKLLPYIYTMNYRVNSKLEPMIQPMYYTHPKCSAAYDVKNQFWFGSELMVAPITEPKDSVDNLAKTTVWLPKGKWFDFFNGNRYESRNGRTIDVFRSLEDYPVFAKSGAIVPMMQVKGNNIENSENMEVVVFPGADNEFSLYEDQGEFDNYKHGAFVITKIEQKFSPDNVVFTINPSDGDTSLIPERRTWKIHFRGFAENMQSKVCVDGVEITPKININHKTHTTTITISASVSEKITVNLQAENVFADNGNPLNCCYRILKQAKINNQTKERVYNLLHQNCDLHTFMYQINMEISEYYHLVSALMEQFTLTRE